MFFRIFEKKILMTDDSSEFIQDVQHTSEERVELYRSRYFVVSKIRLFNKWRIEKRLTAEYEFQPLQRSSLEREFEIGYQLDHPNIVRYLELRKTEQGVPFIIMEYVDGMNLQEYMHSNEICTEQDFITIFTSLLSALTYLQQRQIYHLDIKPENIVVTYKEHIPKLIDFGVSNNDTYQTSLGATKQYSTDEHIDYSKVSSKTDMYSFAKTMNEFANTKQITLGRKEKHILRICSQENPQKRLDASTALQMMQKKSSKGILGVGITFVLTLIICSLLYLGKNNQIEKNDIVEQYDSVGIVDNAVSDDVVEHDSTEVILQTNTTNKKEFVQQSNHNETVETTEIAENNEPEQWIKDSISRMYESVMGIVHDSFTKDSLFIETIAQQKLTQFKDTIATRSIIDKNVIKLQLINQYKKTADSVIQVYMKANKFGMVEALGKIEYSVMDKLDITMDSLAKTK